MTTPRIFTTPLPFTLQPTCRCGVDVQVTDGVPAACRCPADEQAAAHYTWALCRGCRLVVRVDDGVAGPCGCTEPSDRRCSTPANEPCDAECPVHGYASPSEHQLIVDGVHERLFGAGEDNPLAPLRELRPQVEQRVDRAVPILVGERAGHVVGAFWRLRISSMMGLNDPGDLTDGQLQTLLAQRLGVEVDKESGRYKPIERRALPRDRFEGAGVRSRHCPRCATTVGFEFTTTLPPSLQRWGRSFLQLTTDELPDLEIVLLAVAASGTRADDPPIGGDTRDLLEEVADGLAVLRAADTALAAEADSSTSPSAAHVIEVSHRTVRRLHLGRLQQVLAVLLARSAEGRRE